MKKNALFILLACVACSSGHVFKSALRSPAPMKLCFLGDVGKGSGSQKSVADALGEEKCHALYFLGDLIYPHGLKDASDPQKNTKFLDYYLPLAQKDNHPKLHLVLGNHDYRGSPDAWLTIAQTHPEIYFPAFYYFEQYGDVCITSLDTNFIHLIKKFPAYIGEVRWLRKLNLDSCKLKLALAHHPYLSSGHHHGPAKSLMKQFLESEILGKYDYYLSGHEHILSHEGAVKGTELFISGAGGDPDKGQLPGYLILEITQSPRALDVKTILKTIRGQKLEEHDNEPKHFPYQVIK